MRIASVLTLAAGASFALAVGCKNRNESRHASRTITERVSQAGHEPAASTADYTVLKIDRANRTLYLKPVETNKMDKLLQAGRESVLSFDQFNSKVPLFERVRLSADKIHEGDRITIAHDASGKMIEIRPG